MSYLDPIVELPSSDQFEDDIEGILRLEDFWECQVEGRLELSHDFDFLDQTLFSVLFTKGRLLRECFCCKLFSIWDPLHKVHSSKVASPYFLDGFELLVKSFLTDVWLQPLPP